MAVLGMLLMVAGFGVDNAANMPVVLRIIDGEYVRATAGLEKIRTNPPLLPEHDGFKELAGMLNIRSTATGEHEASRLPNIARIYPRGLTESFGANRVFTLTVEMEDGQILTTTDKYFEPLIEQLHTSTQWRWAGRLFLAGFLLTGFGIYWEHFRSNKPQTEEPDQECAAENTQESGEDKTSLHKPVD